MKFQLLKVLLSLLIISAIIPSCRRNPDSEEDKIITVSILPFSYFVEGIAGDDYTVNVIVPPGASPATFEPPPSVIKGLKNSEAVIFNRYLGFEQAWMDKLSQVNPGINTLFLADNQDLIAAENNKHGDHHHLAGVDPHFWMSTSSARIVVRDIRDFLTTVYPEDSEIFETNYNKLVSEIERVNRVVSEMLSTVEKRTFLIFHPALTYFAREFDLVQVPVEYEGKEPTASWLKEVIDLANSEGIRFILVQKEFNRSSAETIAKEIDARVIDISPLSPDWSESIFEIASALSSNNNRN